MSASGRNIELIPDVETREAVRDLAERVRALEEADAATTDMAAVRAALQRGGSTPLDVTGLVGVLAQAQKAQVGMALWYQVTASVAGAGEFQWEETVVHSLPGSLVRRNTSEIHFTSGGLYHILANVEVSTAATVSMLLNGVAIAREGSTVLGSLVALRQIQGGQRLTVTNSAGNRLGNADGRTNLAILRLA